MEDEKKTVITVKADEKFYYLLDVLRKRPDFADCKECAAIYNLAYHKQCPHCSKER